MRLLLDGPVAVRGLLLVAAKHAQLALLGEYALHALRAQRPCLLVLEVAGAVEADALERGAVVAAQRAQEVPLLARVLEARDARVAVPSQCARQVPVAADRHDGDALRAQGRGRVDA